jgi:HlyD family secretion protein
VSTATKTKAPTAAAPVQQKRRRWLVFLVVVAGAGGVGWYYYHTKGTKAVAKPVAEADAEDSAPEPIDVESVNPTRGGIIRTSTQIGSVEPFEEADLYAKISGYLSVLNVDYGDRVKRDQLLAEIDDPEVIKDADKAAADVLQAKAAVAQAEAFIESAKADREALAAAVEQAIAEVERYVSMKNYHEKKYTRYKRLVQEKAIPQQIADEEEEGYESARASEVASQKAVLNAKAQLNAAIARVKKAEADLTEAKANVQVAEAKLAKAKVLVAYTKITSPYDGVVTKRNFFRGAFIRSATEGGAMPLLTVARTDKVRVVTAVPDRDVPFTNVGDPAEITLDALGSEVFRGKVSRFAESEDPTSRTMHTEIDLPNPQNQLHAGMYGIAKIILDASLKDSTLPASCLVGESKNGKGDVYVIKDGKAKKTQVTIGADDGIRVEIVAGLSPKDAVIVNTGSVADGAPVRSIQDVTESAPEAKRETTEKAQAKSPAGR